MEEYEWEYGSPLPLSPLGPRVRVVSGGSRKPDLSQESHKEVEELFVQVGGVDFRILRLFPSLQTLFVDAAVRNLDGIESALCLKTAFLGDGCSGVSLECLTELPQLEHLDLAGATESQLASVSKMAGLAHLAYERPAATELPAPEGLDSFTVRGGGVQVESLGASPKRVHLYRCRKLRRIEGSWGETEELDAIGCRQLGVDVLSLFPRLEVLRVDAATMGVRLSRS